MGRAAKILVAIVLCISGFAAYRAYGEHEALSKLESELYDVRVASLRLTSADIELKLMFHNPTAYDTPPFWVEFDVYLSEGYIGNGSIPETRVPASSSVNRTMTLTVKYVDVAKTIIDAIGKDSFDLTVRGTTHARVLLGTIPVSFAFEESRGP